MRSIYVVLVTILAYVNCEHDAYEGYKTYRIHFNNHKQLDLLQRNYNDLIIDFWIKPTLTEPKRDAIVMVPRAHELLFQDYLREAELSSDIIINDVKSYLMAEDVNLKNTRSAIDDVTRFDFNGYHRFNEINRHLDTLVESYSNILSSVTHSTRTYEGRILRYIKVSTTGFEDATKPVVVIECGITGREWITPALSVYGIMSLVGDSKYSSFLQDIDWIFVPVLNPDSYEYSHSSLRLWTKSRSENSYLGIICPGVNIDRNFDIYWNVSDTSTSPCSHLYPGVNEFSESESKFIKSIIDEYGTRIKRYISIQNNGSYITYPWRYTTTAPNNINEMKETAAKASSAMENVDKYQLGAAYEIHGNLASGTSVDYAYSRGVEQVFTLSVESDMADGYTIAEDNIENACIELWYGILGMTGDFIDDEIPDIVFPVSYGIKLAPLELVIMVGFFLLLGVN